MIHLSAHVVRDLPMLRNPKPKMRIQSLDALRGLAAISVMLHHYSFSYEGFIGPHNAVMPVTFSSGHFGVELFFILSGFVITSSLDRASSFQKYLIYRFARLYPSFFVCSSITLAVFALGGPNPTSVGPLATIVGLTMLAPIVQLPPIDPSHWTLTYEVGFYLLAGLWLRRNVEKRCAIWLGTALVGTIFLPVFAIKIIIILNLPIALLFIIGALLSRLVNGCLQPLGKGTFIAGLSLTALGPFADHGQIGTIGYSLLILLFTFTIWAAATQRLDWLGRTPLTLLGLISYPLYLVHQIIGYAIIKHLEMLGWQAEYAIVFAFSGSIILAYLIHISVEMPAQNVIRQIYEHCIWRHHNRTQANAAPTPAVNR